MSLIDSLGGVFNVIAYHVRKSMSRALYSHEQF